MSTVKRAKAKAKARTAIPPLTTGEHLDQPTFHERYEAMPPDTRAELVGGVVYMPSPLSTDHGEEDQNVSGWLFHYKVFTLGVSGANDTTVKLDPQSEPQPDCQLRIPSELGGQSHIDEHRYVAGAPELIVEVARSSRKFDLKQQKADYEQAGVRECVVVELDPDRIHWFIRRRGRFQHLRPGPDGIHRSEIFPGLWLDPQALYGADLVRLLDVLNQGLAAPSTRPSWRSSPPPATGPRRKGRFERFGCGVVDWPSTGRVGSRMG
jgi:Uma2 family endonuclease